MSWLGGRGVSPDAGVTSVAVLQSVLTKIGSSFWAARSNLSTLPWEQQSCITSSKPRVKIRLEQGNLGYLDINRDRPFPVCPSWTRPIGCNAGPRRVGPLLITIGRTVLARHIWKWHRNITSVCVDIVAESSPRIEPGFGIVGDARAKTVQVAAPPPHGALELSLNRRIRDLVMSKQPLLTFADGAWPWTCFAEPSPGTRIVC